MKEISLDNALFFDDDFNIEEFVADVESSIPATLELPYIIMVHKYGMGQTIVAAINLYNKHALSDSSLLKMISLYNELNGCVPPKVGDDVKIPVITDNM